MATVAPSSRQGFLLVHNLAVSTPAFAEAQASAHGGAGLGAQNVVRDARPRRARGQAKRHKGQAEIPTKAEIRALIEKADGCWRPLVIKKFKPGCWRRADCDKDNPTLRHIGELAAFRLVLARRPG
jgi:hypothetical protein